MRLDDLARRELNFEPRADGEYTPENGWHADVLRQPMPPGDDAFTVARQLVMDYRMADPALVRATYDHAHPLLGRDMVLELRLWRLASVHAGVRVTQVWDEERRFGFQYGTLDGHVEAGLMDYQLREGEDGTLDFWIHAHSRPAQHGLPWVRLGFRIFGRREQLRFYHRCCERIAVLTARELGLPEEPPPPDVSIREADLPDVAEASERLVPRRTRPDG
jgi:uncharacterized protein (UPF0548 family)